MTKKEQALLQKYKEILEDRKKALIHYLDEVWTSDEEREEEMQGFNDWYDEDLKEFIEILENNER